MVKLKINGMEVSVDPGATVLEAAQQIGVEIPTLCWRKDLPPATSCMLCVVKNVKTGQLLPSCSAPAVDGLEVETDCEEVLEARRDILNLLLSEHVGDCEAPCRRICPASLDIPSMLRKIGDGDTEAAAWIAKRDLAIPAILGYVCPAPCEKGCRRAQIDSSITIRELHRDVGRARCPSEPRTAGTAVPTFEFPMSGKRVAVIGSGPAGLSSAWKLRQLGHACTIFDGAAEAGGALLELPEEKLPRAVLVAEIESLKAAGIEFVLGTASPETTGFDAVVEPEEHKLAVKAVANGKAAAEKIDGEFQSLEPAQRFDSKIGKLRESEAQQFLANCPQAATDEMQKEAARCLHCDCRKPVSCKLRKYAEQYGAKQSFYEAVERKHIELIGHAGEVVFEPGKCIKCGLCVQITKRAGEELGLTFVGRGFNTKVKVPFNESLEDGLKKVARECVEACPTGALAFRDADEK
ncbi:MAG: (2Fe-2S)-binding protein [Kiritimatiellales bacterium]|nr:(2Fe-2S)-binding protein [Kiritimatiellales bacterium]